mmetsp:Transcript_12876/g.39729  ORF Transcript_12876/g.39729 Transcript_12876/m.39729 type:complete len:212 (-) Transcript_12876:677-1312(-)
MRVDAPPDGGERRRVVDARRAIVREPGARGRVQRPRVAVRFERGERRRDGLRIFIQRVVEHSFKVVGHLDVDRVGHGLLHGVVLGEVALRDGAVRDVVGVRRRAEDAERHAPPLREGRRREVAHGARGDDDVERRFGAEELATAEVGPDVVDLLRERPRDVVGVDAAEAARVRERRIHREVLQRRVHVVAAALERHDADVLRVAARHLAPL